MRMPDLAPGRIEELLRGVPPDTQREAEVERLVRELRTAAPVASTELRERLGRPPEPPRPRRVPAGAIAFAVVVLVLGSIVGIVGRAGGGADGAERESAGGGSGGGEAPAAVRGDGAFAPEPSTAARQPPLRSVEPTTLGPSIPPESERARDVDMSLELRLRDAEAVSAAAGEAMGIAERLGGHVLASSVQARGGEGSAQLTLRVPVRRLEDAVVRLAALGTITAQNVEIEDLQAGVDARESRVERLRRSIRRDHLRIESGTLSAEERLQTQLRLETLRAQLRRALRARADLLRRAAGAEIRLALHTREAATAGRDEGAIGGAARDAWAVLETLGAVGVFVVVAGAPLIVLGTALWLLLRARGRRAERRLLDEPRPAGARPPA